jgi:filamentous hemagglutinin family protein
LGVALASCLSGALIASSGDAAFAQPIVPDTTLGHETSTLTPLTPTVDSIDGGAIRGINLFHSFLEFNIGNGRSVYFTNPTGIENILSRVTGTNPSNIFGKLGVDGNANLFLINPHGILFGPNARLDIAGSFFATTASSLQFSDGSSFSATNPTAPPLLTVNVTPGVQWGASQLGATITNRGNLAPGQDLTLFADKLDLQGQLQAGRDLTLLAQDTVQVRDSLTTPFLAQAGRHLTVQGNQGIDILALNHPTQIPFVSGGNLSLISDGIISGDARFSSGGSFSIQSVSGGLANFFSEHDPIISAQGDVDVAANYTGTSLLVEATGNIRFQGDINITGPDTSTLPDGPDTATLSSGSALIMRSGQSTLAYGGVNSGNVPVSGSGVVPEGIMIGGNVVVQPFNGVGGIVSLSAASGDVSTQLVSTNGQQILNPKYDLNILNIDANGGAINISAANGSIKTSHLLSYSYSYSGNAGDGGNISLFAANGSINIGSSMSYSYSYSGNAGNGGNISLSATNDITTGGFDSSSQSRPKFSSAGNGGNISLSATNDITTGGFNSSSASYSGYAGSGGNISLSGGNISVSAVKKIPITSTQNFYSFSYGSDSAGNGGNISLFAANDITIQGLDSGSFSSSGNVGNGGAIRLVANGSINTDDLYAGSSSNFGNAGNGGAIRLLAANGNINTGDLFSGSSCYYSGNASGNAGNGGAIRLLAANGNINTGYLSSNSVSDFGNAGNGGAIRLLAANGNINTDNLNSRSSSYSSRKGQGGAIRLVANRGSITFNPDYDGDVPIINASGASGGKITFTSPATIFELKDGSISSDASNGNGGNIQINAASVSLTNTEVTTTARGRGNAGNISIVAEGNVSLDLSRLFTSLEFDGTGKGGDITIEAQAVSLNNSSFIDTATFGQGNAGNVFIKADDDVLLDTNSAIFSITSGVGNGGNVKVEAGEAVSLANRSNISTAVNSGAVGDGGDIDITARSLTLTGGSQLVTSTSSSGQAGNITVNTTQGVTIWGVDPNFTPTQPLNVSVGNPPPLPEEEPNDERTQAQSLTQFFLNSPDDVNPFVELSTRIPYVSISGTSKDTSISFFRFFRDDTETYSFEVTAAGTRAIFDIDTPEQNRASTDLYLLDNDGNRLEYNLEASPSLGAGGSTTTDPYLRYAFSEPGTYFIRVNSSPEGNYTLNVSLDTPNVATSVVNRTLPSGLFARTEGAGAAGNVTINTPQLSVTDGGNISATATATATSTAKGGNIQVNASQVNLQGNTSGLFAQTQGAAPAGSLSLQPYDNSPSLTVNLQQGAQISASTGGSGQGGSLTVTAPSSITLSGNGTLAATADASSTGPAGGVRLTTQELTVTNGAKVSAATNSTNPSATGGNLNVQASQLNLTGKSSLEAGTTGVAPAGSLIIQPLSNSQTLSVNFQDGSTASASTSGSGQGGTLEVTAPESITLTGNGSFIAAETSGSGTGGDLTLKTGTLTVRDQAKVTVSSTGTGNAGNLNVTANTLLLDRGQLIAETASGEGGNINLKVEDLLLMRNNSLISAEAGNNGNGGNIDIDSRLIVAVPSENSDIVADAERGNGGNINITTSGIFGLEFRQQRTPESDITASSRFGIAGTVNINQLAIDPSQGLTNLPTAVADASNQIAQTCSASGEEAKKNQFIITGRGGLPQSPNDLLTPDLVQDDFGILTTGSETASAAKPSPGRTNPPTQLVEAQGWMYGPDGKVVLTASVPNATPQATWQTSVDCQVSQPDSQP